MDTTLSNLLERLAGPGMSSTNVIRWSSPVPSFGDLSRSRVATLGLNPSNREFVDPDGQELSGTERRFHTLTSLGLACWSEATTRHVELIVDSCRGYFFRNPYDGWFRQLDHIISGTAASYYDKGSTACHLDLIPYATTCKWMELTRTQRSTLLSVAGDTLGHLLKESPVRVLVLNGRSVVEQFQEMAGLELERQAMPQWALRRGARSHVAGYAYKGTVCEVAGVKFKREILVLGFNHNIQSSFGVTNEVRNAIRRWITQAAKEVMT
jgi:hypothetical protein